MASFLRASCRATVSIFDRAFIGSVTGNSLSVSPSGLSACGRLFKVGRCSGLPVPWGSATVPLRAYSRRPAGRTSPGALSRSDSESDSESDSDSEGISSKGNSEFWRRKMRTFHRLIDLNKDGVVSFDDFTLLAERFINLGHLTKAQEEEFKKALKVVWEDQWGKVHPYNLVTTEQYLENMHHIINDVELRHKAHYFLPHLFEAIDNDKDGTISVDEFKLFFECLGLSKDEAITTFRVIDRNKDGCVHLKEFVRLGREFFFIEDETHPSTLFWGPLIKP